LARLDLEELVVIAVTVLRHVTMYLDRNQAPRLQHVEGLLHRSHRTAHYLG
jgi:hypothetical protein